MAKHPLLGPNLGRASLRDRPELDDAIHVLAPGEYETTLCGQNLDDTVNASSMDTGYKPDDASGCWTCLGASNRWATAPEKTGASDAE